MSNTAVKVVHAPVTRHWFVKVRRDTFLRVYWPFFYIYIKKVATRTKEFKLV